MSWPATFGDATAEYVAAHDEGGYLGGQTALAWATGLDTISFLQGIITQDVAAMQAGAVARSLLLEPRGKLDGVMWLLRGEERVGILTDAAQMDHLVASLTKWRFRVEVEFSVDERPVFDVFGPDGASLVPTDGWTDTEGLLGAVLAHEPIQHRVVVGVGEDRLRSSGLQPIGKDVATTLRIEVGEPRMDIDINNKTIPQESGLVPTTVSFTKGCYLGQELVARIDSRGHVNRHLRGLRLHDAVIPPRGADVLAAEATVGEITSVGESLAIRAPVALALIRREIDPGSAVEIVWDGASATATVEQLPMI